MKAILCLPLSALIAMGAVAAEPDSGTMQTIMGPRMIEMMGWLILTVVVIFALSHLMRRMKGLPTGMNQHLRIVAGLHLGSRERVLLLQAADKHILVAVSPQSISALHVFDNFELPPAPGGDNSASTSRFADLLRGSISRAGQ